MSRFQELAAELAGLSRDLYARGWAAATSGNFSAVVSREPFRLAVTASGRDKGKITADDVLEVDETGTPIAYGTARPSAETAIHVALARERGAEAVAHVHTVWGTVLSERHAAAGGVEISGLEMLKALDGVATHEHREWVPILENTQTWDASAVAEALRPFPDAHAFLIRGHGMYTWGRDAAELKRHVEGLEFLLEVVARRG